MTERVKMLLERQKNARMAICSERVRLMIPVLQANAGRPQIVQRAMAVAEYLNKRTLIIEDGELLVGNLAAEPNGLEADPYTPCWPEDDLQDMLKGYKLYLSPEAKEDLALIDPFALNKGRTRAERRGVYYDDARLWPFIQHGFLSPGWKKKNEGRGYGMAGTGWGFPSVMLFTPDFGKIIAEGFEAKIREVETAYSQLRYQTKEDCYKADFYEASLILLKAMIRQSERYAALAREKAAAETDETRRRELLTIAETFGHVPAKPARTFREALQAFFCFWCYGLNGTMPGGRFDEFMYPYYKADLEAGRMTREEALELLECLRIKIMQYNSVGGGKAQREKWAGMARWHNFILGGVDREGNEITNDVSYLMIEAAMETRTPHPTLSVRVNENTPPELIQKSLELVRAGMGMPAFLSEKSYINFLLKYGVPLEEAREFAIAGCLDVQLPGKSRNNAFGMLIVPMIFELAMNNGRAPGGTHPFGPATGKFTEFEDFESFYQAFLKQLDAIVSMVNEEHNICLTADGDNNMDALVSVFAHKGVEYGRDLLSRPMLFENASVCNMVGMTNVADSLAAVKKLVFEDKSVSAERLEKAIQANWEGYEDIRKLCLDAPKFGNNDAYVDDIAARLWKDYSEIVSRYQTVFQAPLIPTATSIVAHVPGGATTGATPDGRMAGDTLADGSVSPAQGKDHSGPLAVLQSGMRLNQDSYMATLLNMKFTTNTLKTDSDLEKLASLIRVYLTNGGKHVQFNVVDRAELVDAQKEPEKHQNLVVRVAGYSAYFTALQPKVQKEIIDRSALAL